MSKSILITRPEHDDTTYYLSKWSEKAMYIAQSKGMKIFDLHRDRANKKEVTGILAKKNPNLVILNGHGSDVFVSGHRNEPLIIARDNEHLLKGKITYAISCKSAKELGPKTIDAGGKNYIGYTESFIFFYDLSKITHPLKDATASLFLEPSNEIIVALIKGNTAEESHNRAKQLFKNNIKKFLSSETTPQETSIARYVWWDMMHLVCLGNKNRIVC